MEEIKDFLAMSNTDRLKELVYLLESGIDGDIDGFIYQIKEELELREECSYPYPDRYEIEKRVIHIIQDEYDYEATLQSVLGEDFYFDSLDSVELTMHLEKEFDISIPDEEMFSYKQSVKVADIVDYIVKKLEKK